MLEIMNENHEIIHDSQEPEEKQSEKGVKLPRIERIPSRGTQKEVKSSTKLPTLKIDPNLDLEKGQSERLLSTEEDFVGQVQRKIRMVLESQHIVELEECEESDSDNFEKKIIQNKEIIRRAKRKNQKLKKQNEQLNNNAKMHQKLVRKISQGNRNEAYQKRSRQYKQGCGENMIIPKKKDLVVNFSKQKEASQPKEVRNFNGALREFVSNKEINIREVKSKEELLPLHKIMPNYSNKLDLNSVEPRKLKKQFSHKILTPIQKNQQLFDAIHNYLENPKKHDVDVVNLMKLGKDKAELEKKLRWYEQKINASACEEIGGLKPKLSLNSEEATESSSDMKMATSSQWNPVHINERGLFAQENSSFDKQIDRINCYLQRNEQSLEKYVQNQKILVDVQLASQRKSRERVQMK